MRQAGTTILLLLVLAAADVCASPAQQAPAPAATTAPAVLSLEEYIAALDKLIQQTESASQRELWAIHKTLPDAWHVHHRGQVVEVSLAWLGETANMSLVRPKEEKALVERARRRLRHLRDEAQGWMDSNPGGAGSARDQLDAILARPEFGKVRGPSWLDRLRARISEWLIGMLTRLLGQRGFSLAGGIIMWSLIGLSLAVVVVWGVRALQRRFREPVAELKGVAQEKFTWRRWGQQALASAARGDYRAAIHHAYWASIYRMEELGAWEIDRARTHREYLRLLPAQHEQRANLTGLTRRFEAVWYGRQAATAEDFREATASLERLGCLLGSMPATVNS